MKSMIRKRRIRDVTFLSLSSTDGYAGMGREFVLLCWYATVAADCFHDIHNLMLVNAVDPSDAVTRLNAIFEQVLVGMEQGGWRGLRKSLKRAVSELANIPMKIAAHQVPTILLAGEIYVRAEGLARRWLPEYLAKHGLATHMAPLHEWVHYTRHQYSNKANDLPTSRSDRLANTITWKIMIRAEKDVKNILVKSGWYVHRPVDMNRLVEVGGRFISPNLFGEAILTVGSSLAEVGTHVCGSIAIGPFGCMPNRLSESILNVNSDRKHLVTFRKDKETDRVSSEMEMMPFLAIETDGSPFLQIIEARLETFVLQARRLHDIMVKPQVQVWIQKKEKPHAVLCHVSPAFSRALRLAANPALAQRAARIRAVSGYKTASIKQ